MSSKEKSVPLDSENEAAAASPLVSQPEPAGRPGEGEGEEAEEANDDADDNDNENEEEEFDEAEAERARRKQPIKYIQNRTRRHVTFAKRRHGIMKKAYELSVLTGANILLLIQPQNTGLVYTFSTPRLEPVITGEEGKGLVRRCLAQD
ncbi:Arg80 protein [Maudiozyma humilis]|uniref:Arg80 protein n=1 Tax=Maudiozyma humilis TaxID=51915 RepID=A0AAV5S3V0_MAUHU|nr:Arg80 protein [Kazachstania humilis]